MSPTSRMALISALLVGFSHSAWGAPVAPPEKTVCWEWPTIPTWPMWAGKWSRTIGMKKLWPIARTFLPAGGVCAAASKGGANSVETRVKKTTERENALCTYRF